VGGIVFESFGIGGGYEQVLDSHTKAGVSVGYTSLVFDTPSLYTSIEGDIGTFAVYGSFQKDRLTLSAAAGVSVLDYQSQRSPAALIGEQPSGEIEGRQVSALLRSDFAAVDTPSLILQPFIEFAYSGIVFDQITETGASNALFVDIDDVESARGNLGFNVTSSLRAGGDVFMTARLGGFWSHEFGDVTRSSSASFAAFEPAVFRIHGRTMPRDSGTVTGTLSIRNGDGLTMDLGLEGHFGEGYRQETMYLQFRGSL
jgi:outer membrane autotransporter protein